MRFVLLIIVVLFHSCAIVDKSQYFEPIGKSDFSKMTSDQSRRIYNSHLRSIVHLKKFIIGQNLDTIGYFIIKRFGYDHQKSVAFGLGLPFIPNFLIEPNQSGWNDLIEVGINYYDTCNSFNSLNENSFCLIADNNDTIKCNYGFFKRDKDCEFRHCWCFPHQQYL